MPNKRPAIKWRDTDEEKLSRAVRNYNRKLDRLAKTQPYLADMLPDRLNKRELKNRIMTRSDFNRVVRSAERFSQRGAEQIVTNEAGFSLTRYEKREVAYKLSAVNRRRAELLQKYEAMEVMSQGKTTGQKRGQMPSIRMRELAPKKFNWSTMTRQHYDQFVKTLNKQAYDKFTEQKNALHKRNYIKAFKAVFGNTQPELLKRLMELPAEDIVDKYYTDQNATFDFYYDPIALDLKAEVLKKTWL